MAMACCRKDYAEVSEILVCVDALAPHNPGLYQRLRFALLASSWLPIPLGTSLWSALHVMLLIAGGPAFWVLSLLIAFLFYSVFVFGFVGFLFCGTYLVCSLVAMAIDLIFLLGRSIRFCWSLEGFLACHEPIAKWRWDICWTGIFWNGFKGEIRDMFCFFLSLGVPCMSGSVYKETKDQKMKTWARWFQEVVHMPDAIAL